MDYYADPGGVFASDQHRRVLAHLPGPDDEGTTVEDLLERLRPDAGSNFTDEQDVHDVLLDLEADGHAADGKMTEAGFAAVTGPNAEEGE